MAGDFDLTETAEIPQVLLCEGDAMVGILHKPTDYSNRAVILLVGGPQTRVGSHRQFVLLSRDLAARGIAVLRFDFRGMGDSQGPDCEFLGREAEISIAIDHLFMQLPQVEEIVLWGLCDAASAALMYASKDDRVTGLVLLNPWVRTECTEARAYLKRYYIAKVVSRRFWRRLLTGELNVLQSIWSFACILVDALTTGRRRSRVSGKTETDPGSSYVDRMCAGLEAFTGRILLIMSGQDLTAAEFDDTVKTSRKWRRALAKSSVTRRDLFEANHTFSRRIWRDQVSRWCVDWCGSW